MKVFHWRSLKTRVTLFTLAIFLLCIWSLALSTSLLLRQDMKQLLGKQQFSTASMIAADIEQAVQERFNALNSIAASLDPALLRQPARLQTELESRTLFQSLFNAGVIVIRPDGATIADVPRTTGRMGTNYMDLDSVAAALQQGKSTVSRAVMGKKLLKPVFGMTVPIRDAQGQVVGALSGITNLGQPNFLDIVSRHSYGSTGHYFLMAPASRLIITSSKASRIMGELPAPGLAPGIDRALQGFEGSDVFLNSFGVEMLAATKGIPAAGWVVATSITTDEAFTPIRDMQQRVLWGAMLLSLLAGALVWRVLQRQLAPMAATVRQLDALQSQQQPLQALPLTHQPETDTLITAVNQLLAALGQREQALSDGEAHYRTLVSQLPVGVLIQSPTAEILMSNAIAQNLLGLTADQLAGQTSFDPAWNVVHEDGTPFPGDAHPVPQAIATRQAVRNQTMGVYRPATQDRVWLLVTAEPQLNAQGDVWRVICTFVDVTEHRRATYFEQFRNRILEQLTSGCPLPEVLDALVRGVEQVHPEMLCSIMLMSSDGRHLHRGAAPSLPEFYNAALEGIEIGVGVGSCGTAAHTGERVIVNDVQTHPYWAPYTALAASAGLGACWSQPIRASSGQVLGTFAIYHHQAHTPRESDFVIIDQAAQLASLAIERSQAATKLRDSEALHRLLTEDVTDVVWKQDKNNHFTYISPADERLRGYTADEVVGRHVFELMTDDGIALIKGAIKQRQADDQKQAKSGTSRLILQEHCKDGSLIWVEVLSTPERDEHGNITGYHGISRDITERRRAEAELRIAAIAFESQEGMFVTDATSKILRVNQAFTAITGYTSDEAVGQTPSLINSGRHEAAFFVEMKDTITRTGRWQGEVWNRRKNGDIHPEWLSITAVKDAQDRVTHFVSTLTDITARKAADDKIRHLAYYDALTGLPNRRLLLDRLEKTLAATARHEREGALLFVDLDRFKQVNDTLGHDMGDLLLQQVARRLQSCVREGDTVARLGGDEFVVMLEDLSATPAEAASQAKAAGEKMLEALNQPYRLGLQEHTSTLSIGVTLFSHQHGSVDELLKRADLAMFQAKSAGRNTLRFFDPVMQAAVTARAALERDLGVAVRDNQFLLHYQAQVSSGHQLLGAEVLVRWQHPRLGLVSPAEFIPLAEETGLILPMGHWVLQTACQQLVVWAATPRTEHLTLAVNVSARQFNQPDFVAQVLLVLQQTGANPQRLKLELTESMLVSNVEDIITKMTVLKTHQVSFSLDDFGTGYSSLSYLKRLPLSQLKIDQGFVRDILNDVNDAAIAGMVIALGQSMGLSVIAEGVETPAQRDFLAAQGCHAYQGYLFSKPLPLAAFEAFAQQL